MEKINEHVNYINKSVKRETSDNVRTGQEINKLAIQLFKFNTIISKIITLIGKKIKLEDFI